jgi:hypothetical protein
MAAKVFICRGTLKSPTPFSRKAASKERKIESARSCAIQRLEAAIEAQAADGLTYDAKHQ